MPALMFVVFFFLLQSNSPLPSIHGCIASCRVMSLFYEGIYRNIVARPQSCHYCWVPEGSGAGTLSEVANQLHLEFLVEVKYVCEKILCLLACTHPRHWWRLFFSFFFFLFKDSQHLRRLPLTMMCFDSRDPSPSLASLREAVVNYPSVWVLSRLFDV